MLPFTKYGTFSCRWQPANYHVTFHGGFFLWHRLIHVNTHVHSLKINTNVSNNDIEIFHSNSSDYINEGTREKLWYIWYTPIRARKHSKQLISVLYTSTGSLHMFRMYTNYENIMRKCVWPCEFCYWQIDGAVVNHSSNFEWMRIWNEILWVYLA